MGTLSSLASNVKRSQRGTTAIPNNANATFSITLATSVSSGKYQLTIYNSTYVLGDSVSSFTVSISGTSMTFTQLSSTLWPAIFKNNSGLNAAYLIWELTEFN